MARADSTGRARVVADNYIDQLATLHPEWAAAAGFAAPERLTDYSPGGEAERAALRDQYMKMMRAVNPVSPDDRTLKKFFMERLEGQQRRFQSGAYMHSMAPILEGPARIMPELFERLPKSSAQDWARFVSLMQEVPKCLQSIRASLDVGLEADLIAHARPAKGYLRAVHNILGGPSGISQFSASAQEYAGKDQTIQQGLHAAARNADAAYQSFAGYLEAVYLPAAQQRGGAMMGEGRYVIEANVHLGKQIQPRAVYAQAWEALAKNRELIAQRCDEVASGKTLEEIKAALDSSVVSRSELERFVQGLYRHAAEMLEPYFDIDEALRRIDVRFVERSGPPAYQKPSTIDGTPGTYEIPAMGVTEFPLWTQAVVALHEGLPGHHLELGGATYLAHLSKFQRLAGYVPGYSEGWGLYAELLAEEVGIITKPETKLARLLSEQSRIARVLVDIGLNAGYDIPPNERVDGETVWTPDVAERFFAVNSTWSQERIVMEVDRCLGVPGQPASYWIGMQAWLDARELAGASVENPESLKAFHTKALHLGPLGLDQFADEIVPPATELVCA